MPREPRVFTACTVEFDRLGKRVRATTQDISRSGVFVRTDEYLPVGDVLELTLVLPSGEKVALISRVAHLLSAAAARALGRQAGMGFELLEQDGEKRVRLNAYLDTLLDGPKLAPGGGGPEPVRVLVADSSTRLLERLSTALGDAGFEVEMAVNGAEAYSAVLSRPPAILLLADEMPVMDGWTLIGMLAAHTKLAEVALCVMSADGSDITRLRAYRLGVRDFIHKPFTDEELCIRLRRLATPALRPEPERVVLRGSVAEIGVATLLSLLDFERKSGIMITVAKDKVARVFVAAGRVVKVESSADIADPRKRLMAVLDWNQGSFEFIACDVVGTDEIGLPTQHILLEHARVKDEASR